MPPESFGGGAREHEPPVSPARGIVPVREDHRVLVMEQRRGENRVTREGPIGKDRRHVKPGFHACADPDRISQFERCDGEVRGSGVKALADKHLCP